MLADTAKEKTERRRCAGSIDGLRGAIGIIEAG
jgi:hypothetical protein